MLATKFTLPCQLKAVSTKVLWDINLTLNIENYSHASLLNDIYHMYVIIVSIFLGITRSRELQGLLIIIISYFSYDGSTILLSNDFEDD